MGAPGDGWVTVHVTADPVEGEMLTELLHGEAIPARLSHVNAQLLGAGTQVFQIRIDVPAELAGRARELLAELEHVGAVEGFDADGGASAAAEAAAERDEADGEDGDTAAPVPPPRRPWAAAGIAFIVPGGGHLHARRPLTALVMASGLAATLAALYVNRHRTIASDILFAVGVAVVFADSAGGFRAARAFDPARRIPAARQVARGLALLALAALAGSAAAWALNVSTWRGARLLDALSVTCGPSVITVENQGEVEHTLRVDRIRLGAPGFPPDGIGADVAGPSVRRLAPGARVELALGRPLAVIEACAPSNLPDWAAPRRPSDCWMWFDLELQEPASRVTVAEAFAGCKPDWADARVAAPAFLDQR